MKPRPVGISVIVPVFNEVDSVSELLRQIRAALGPTGRSYEVVLIDDGSTDGTWEVLKSLAAGYPNLRALRLTGNFGQTAALMAGIHACTGDIVVTLDGDLQNDPADIPGLVAKLEEGYEIVSGWRRARKDGWLLRRLPSRVANTLIRRITQVEIHDQGCALKAYRGPLLRTVALYSDFHRFIVPLTQMGGARVTEVETNHRPRMFGRSKYGIGRVFRVLADMTTLLMITRFSDRLLLWFLAFALPPLLLGCLAFAWALHEAIGARTSSLTVPIGASVLLVQCALAIAFCGLLAERMRHLAPVRGVHGHRILATLAGPAGRSPEALLIQTPRRIDWNSGVALSPRGERLPRRGRTRPPQV